MARPQGQRLDAETRKAQIVDAAANVLHGRDPHEVTFEEVADAAGVSRALVYNYFHDKGELVAAVHLRSLRRLDDALQAAGDEVPGDGSLPVLVRTYLRFAEADPEAFRNLVDTEVAHHPEVRAARSRRLDRIARAWGDTPEARVAAAAVLGLLEGATREWLEERDLSGEVNHVADVLVAVLRQGLPTTGTGT